MKKFAYDFDENLEKNVQNLMMQLEGISYEEFSTIELNLWFQNLAAQIGLIDYNAESYKKELFEAHRDLKKLNNELEGYRFANISPINVNMLVEEEIKAKKNFFKDNCE